MLIYPKCSCEEQELSINDLITLYGLPKINTMIWNMMNDSHEINCLLCLQDYVPIKTYLFSF